MRSSQASGQDRKKFPGPFTETTLPGVGGESEGKAGGYFIRFIKVILHRKELNRPNLDLQANIKDSLAIFYEQTTL